MHDSAREPKNDSTVKTTCDRTRDLTRDATRDPTRDVTRNDLLLYLAQTHALKDWHLDFCSSVQLYSVSSSRSINSVLRRSTISSMFLLTRLVWETELKNA